MTSSMEEAPICTEDEATTTFVAFRVPCPYCEFGTRYQRYFTVVRGGLDGYDRRLLIPCQGCAGRGWLPLDGAKHASHPQP
jgi:hypothetical protein